MSLPADLFADLPYTVEPMQVPDIEEVILIDRQSFSTPWSYNAYHYEIERNDMAHYFVLRPRRGFVPADVDNSWRRRVHRWLGAPSGHELGPILGYGGMWLMYDEAHISTIAVRPEWRGRGLGELLLLVMLSQAMTLHAHVVTLEVRVTNHSAQQLYEKYGFSYSGRRPRYYTDNGEDAFLMTTQALEDLDYRGHLLQLGQALHDRLLREAQRVTQS